MAKNSDKHSPEMIERGNAEFRKWRSRNPSGEYKDYFAETVKEKLDRGKSHATLGSNLLVGDFKTSGAALAARLKQYGLGPDHVCVDYGCGTLRVGVHLIDYLRPGAYWGLDVADFLFVEARKLVGEELWLAKKPNLRIISPASISEVVAARPNFLFSTAVLLHVHPDELSEYVGNVVRLIGDRGQAIIIGRWALGETLQTSGQSWAHGKAKLLEMFAEQGADVEILAETKAAGLETFGDALKRCVLRLVPASRPKP